MSLCTTSRFWWLGKSISCPVYFPFLFISLIIFFAAVSFFLPPSPTFLPLINAMPVCPLLSPRSCVLRAIFLGMLYLVTKDDWFHVGHN